MQKPCAQVSPLALAQSAASSQASLTWPSAWQVEDAPLGRHTNGAAHSLFCVQLSVCCPCCPHFWVWPMVRHTCSQVMPGPHGLPSGTRQ